MISSKLNQKKFESEKLTLYDYGVIISIIGIISFQDNSLFFLGSHLLLFSITILNLIKNKKEPLVSLNVVSWMTLFFIWSALSSIWAINMNVVFVNLLSIIQTFAINFCIVIYIQNIKKLNCFYTGFILSAIILFMRIFLTTSFNEWGTERLGASIGYNQNNVGMIFSFASLLVFFKYRETKNVKILIISFLLIGFSFLTGSRKAFVITIVGPILTILLTNRKKDVFKSIFISAVLVLLSFYLIMNVEIFYQVIGVRIESMLQFFTESGTVDKSTDTRLLLIQSSWESFINRPIGGLGLDNFKLVNFYGTYAHNNYFELLASLGIVGVLAYYAFPIKILLSSLKEIFSENKEYTFIVTIIICIFIIDFWNVSYWMELMQLLFGFVFGYYNVLKKRKEGIN